MLTRNQTPLRERRTLTLFSIYLAILYKASLAQSWRGRIWQMEQVVPCWANLLPSIIPPAKCLLISTSQRVARNTKGRNRNYLKDSLSLAMSG